MDALFAGPGEARSLCRSVDWSATPPGPVESWPAALRSAVRLCLDSLTPMAVWAGPTFTVIHNDAYIPVLGLKSGWAMGRPAQEVWSEVWEVIGPEFRHVLEHGDSTRHERARFRLRRADREEDAYFNYSITPVREDDGRVVALFNVLEEITSSVLAHTEREARYRTLFERIDEGFCIVQALVDPDGRPFDYRFLETNPAFELKTGLRGAAGRTARELVPDAEPFWLEMIGQVCLSGEPRRFEEHSTAMNRWFDVYAFRVEAPDDHKVAVLFNDTTRRRRVEDAQRASEARQRLLLEVTDAVGPLRDPTAIKAAAAETLGRHLRDAVDLGAEPDDDSDRDVLREVVDRTWAAVERAKAEEALRESEEKFRVLIEASSQAVWETDADGAVVDDSPSWRAFTGQSLEEWTAHDGWVNAVHPEDREYAERRWREAFDARKDLNCEFRLRSPGGGWRWTNVRAAPIRRADGSIVKWVGMNLDITDRKTAEEDLRRSRLRIEQERARLQAIIDTIPIGLFIMDADGKVIASSEESKRIWGGARSADKISDYAEYAGYWPDTGERLAPEEWPASQALLHGRSTKGLVVDIDRFDGTRGTVVISSAPIKDEDGNTTGAVVGMHDISELRQVQARLEEADRRKNQFLAVLSHELRNPLMPVRNSLHVLHRAASGSEQAARAVAVIDRQIDQLSHLVDDLLDVTRIASGKIQLQRSRLELNELVRRTMDDHRSMFEEAGLNTHLALAPQEVFINADWNRIAQVLGNLLQNATKFTPRAGLVTVTSWIDASAEQGVVRVADTGVGMTPEMFARLFEPFMQADATLDRSKGGLGLGLALIKGLVEQHGGSIEAQSDGIGRGSVFTVRLPLDLAEQPAEVPAAWRAPHAGKRVLLIEDNLDAADSLKDALECEGHQVAIAHDGPDGLVKALEFRPEVVLCDIGLPGMDGYDVARAFRKDEALRGVRLVALSGYARPEDVQLAKEAGFDEHLAKPPSFEKLERILGAPPLSK